MKKWVKITAALLVLGILAGASGYVFIYNKPHVNYEKAKAEFHFTSEQLYSLYLSGRDEAERRYNGRVLEVTGRVSAVENPDSLTVIVFALNQGMFGDEGIRCTMLENFRERANSLASTDLVTIKGYVTGYNDTDVILEKCSVVN